MLKIDSYEELLNIMIEDAIEEGTVSFITDTNGICEMLDLISETTLKPDMINFNNSCDNYYYICFDCDDDNEMITYSICEGCNNDHFFGMQGVVYTDSCIPKKYYEDVKSNKYIKDDPIKVEFLDDCDGDCENCSIADSNETTRIDADEDTGKILGFNKNWIESGNGIRHSYSFSFHSSNEGSVKEMMKKFGIE